MSHSLARYCAERLTADIETLPAQQKRIRGGIQTFLLNQRNGGARDVVRRCRRLSIFMRMHRERWPGALDHLFSMQYVEAEETITKYRRWVARKEWSSIHKVHMNAWGFVRLSRELKKHGLLKWELKHVCTQCCETPGVRHADGIV
jgi:hypothetical protein